MGNAADLQPSTEDLGATSTPAVSVDVTVAPVLTAALAEQAVPVVSRLTLSSAESVRGAVLRLSVRDAEGALGPAVSRLVDLDAGRSTVIGDVGLTLDPAALRPVAEQRTGWVRVELEADGQVLAQRRLPVQVLPPDRWRAAPLPLALELLAAHVRPDSPAVAALLADATQLLEEGTGSGSMAGYDDDADRVDEVVEALTWAVRRRDIRYSEPPEDWAEAGQPVRTPDEVLGGRVGTALDTVLTLAAALEKTGLRPLLWIAEGHAFLGWWREERSAETAATTDVAALVGSVDRGLIGLVETTLLTDRGDSRTDLQGPAYAWLSGDRSRVVGVTDVHRARLDGVRPLPAAEDDDPADAEPAAPEEADADPRLPATVQRWRAALLDPTSSLVSDARRDVLPLAVPADAVPVLAELLGAGAPLTLLPTDGDENPERELLTGSRSVHVDVPTAGYPARLRGLAQQARTGVEETGANDLHLALGTLVWELDGRPVRSPLVLLPVVLTRGDDGYRLTADESGAAVGNGRLLAELQRRHDLPVPGLGSADGDGAGLDVGTALTAVRTALAERRLPWRVEATAELAVLPVAAHRRARDLDAHWPELAGNPLVAHLIADPAEPFTDPAGPVPEPAAADLDELAARCPLPADATQLRAVAVAGAGRTFVLEAAPGTGATQTITNLVARAVADGKKVLVVAARSAALDAVARRLDAVGLGPVTLDLHGAGGRPAVVRAQVRASLEHTVPADEPGLAADVEDLRAATATLARYAEQLHAQNPAGLSYWSAHAAALAAGDDVAALPVTASFAARADADVVTAVHRALALLPDIAGLARPSAGHAWGFLDTIELDIDAVQQAAVAVDTAIRELPGEGGLAAAVRAARTPHDLDALVHLLEGPRIGLDVLDEVRSPRWAAATTDVTGELAALVAAEHAGFDVVTPAVLGLPLADLAAQAQSAGTTGWWGRRGQLGALREQLTPVLRPGATLRGKDVPALLDSVGRVQAAVHGIAARAATIPGLQVPARWNPFTEEGRYLLDAEVRWLRRAAVSVDGSTGFPAALRRFLSAGPVADPAAAPTVIRLRDAVRALLEVCSSTSELLTAWCGEHGLVLRWTMTRPERGVEYVHPLSLRRWVSLLDTLEPLRLAGLTQARLQLRNGLVPAEDAVRAFDRGLAEAVLAERATATGLDAFDAGRHERTVNRFSTASRAVRSHLTVALPAAVLAARSAAVDAEQVAALRRALDEPGDGGGVRGLLAGSGELVTTLLPCVLAGPEAVARFLPATAGLFDLVVVDEAAGLQVADAVGALGRARAAVVVGDSAELPTGSGDDADSLLAACLRAGVPRLELGWQHRSADEALFALPNAHSHGNRISTFPAPAHDPASGAVSLLRVDGSYVRSGAGAGTNPVEARAVAAEVLRRFAAGTGTPSIGVVTVTPAQRALVETLLRDSGDDRVAEALDAGDLLVTDLGTGRGDARDVVLLSLGVSPDRSGRVPLDLGALSRSGGERRLDGALTRARRQVVVIASFDPQQLPAEQTAAAGVAHLRGFLELAAHGTGALARPAAPTDRHRDDVAAALRGRGLVVSTAVGLSPFRIDLTAARPEEPGTPLLAVLLDGPEWAQRATVGDRDGLPAEVLTDRLHWPAVERVWLPAWRADRDGELDRLVAAVAAAAPAPVVEEPEPEVEAEVDAEPYDGPLAEVIPLRPLAARRAVEPEPEPDPEPQPEPEATPTPLSPVVVRPATPAPPAGPLDEELPFFPWTPRPAGEKKQLDQLADPAVARVVRRVLAAGLKAEGPVHRDRLTRTAAAAFGLTRVTEARREALLALLPKTAVVRDEFVWPAGLDPQTWAFFRRQTSSTQRPLEHVAPEEIGNAMVALARAESGLTRDELYARALAAFGHRRRTPAQLPLLDAALAAVLSSGRLTEHPDGTVTG